MVTDDLDGVRVLVAEDSFVVALDLENTLTAFGCRVLGPVASVAAGLVLLERQRPDLALLDVELQDGWITPLAEALVGRNVPFLLVTGYEGGHLVQPLLCAAPRLAKPWSEHDLARALQRLWWQQRVRERAYAIWELEGCPEGQAERHWLMAESELQAAQARAFAGAAGTHRDLPYPAAPMA